MFTKAQPTVVLEEYDPLFLLSTLTSIPWDVRMGSVLVSLFPYVKQDIPASVKFVSLPRYLREKRIPQLPKLPTSNHDCAVMYVGTAAIAGLYLLYSGKYQAKDQIAGRISDMASCASFICSNVTEDDFQKLLEQTNAKEAKMTNWLIDLIGLIVARNKALQYDINVTTKDLADAYKMKADGLITPLAFALLEQMRTAYSGFQMTVELAMELYKKILKEPKKPPSIIYDDVIYMSKLVGFLQESVYCGLVGKPNPQLQARMYPYLAYMGLLYQEREELKTDEEQAEWTKYAIGNLADHIQDNKGKALCRAYVDQIPDMKTSSIVMILQECARNDEEREVFFSRLSLPEEKEKRIRLILSSRKSVYGEWAVGLVQTKTRTRNTSNPPDE